MEVLINSEIINKDYVYANHIVDLMQKSGHIRTLGFGMEHLPKEGGYMMYPNHQG